MRTIILDRPVEGGAGLVTQLRFREPSFRDLVAVNADVDRVVRRADGAMEMSTDFRAVDALASRLIEEPAGDPFVLQALGVADSLKVVDVIRSFFSAGSSPTGSRSQTGSSSISGGTPAPSPG